MKKTVLIVLMVVLPNVAWSQVPPTAQIVRSQELIGSKDKLLNQLLDHKDVRVKRIVVSGLGLRDKQELAKIIKSNRNKKLSKVKILEMIDQIRALYVEAGYSGLVEFNYTIKKQVLLINVSLVTR